MSLQDAVTLLAQVPLFQGVDPVRLEVLAFTATHLAYQAGDTLVEEGHEADGAFLLLSGEAVMFCEGQGGQRQAARLDRGDFFGETSLAQPAPWSATVRAAKPVEILKLERDVFLRLAEEFPEIAQGCFRSAVDQVASLGRDLQMLNQRLTQAREKRRAFALARGAHRHRSNVRQKEEATSGDQDHE